MKPHAAPISVNSRLPRQLTARVISVLQDRVNSADKVFQKLSAATPESAEIQRLRTKLQTLVDEEQARNSQLAAFQAERTARIRKPLASAIENGLPTRDVALLVEHFEREALYSMAWSER